MIIKQAIAELELKNSPVAKLMHTGVAFKVIVLAFKRGMVLRNQKNSVPTKLIILNGNVKYSSGNLIRIIDMYEEIEIPFEETHTIEAIQDSLCLLIQGYRN